MRHKRPGNAVGRRPRPGFTLVEMLVVIAIIAVLIGMSSAAYFVWINRQSQDTTETVMRDVYKVLERQMKAVVDTADKENIPPSVVAMATIPGNGPDMRRARVIWKKLRLKQDLPMTFAEALNPWQAPGSPLTAADLPGKRGYADVLKTAVTGPADSSACLLMSLAQSRGGVRLTPDELPSNALGDTNGDGVKEILDGWGNPIAFFRWPTGNTELNSMNPSKTGKTAMFADPLDPDGLLLNPAWYWLNGKVGTPNPNRVAFENLCHPISPDGTSSFYILPTLVSAGNDGQFGLSATMQETATTALDNTYSFRLQLGARGAKQ